MGLPKCNPSVTFMIAVKGQGKMSRQSIFFYNHIEIALLWHPITKKNTLHIGWNREQNFDQIDTIHLSVTHQ